LTTGYWSVAVTITYKTTCEHKQKYQIVIVIKAFK